MQRMDLIPFRNLPELQNQFRREVHLPAEQKEKLDSKDLELFVYMRPNERTDITEIVPQFGSLGALLLGRFVNKATDKPNKIITSAQYENYHIILCLHLKGTYKLVACMAVHLSRKTWAAEPDSACVAKNMRRRKVSWLELVLSCVITRCARLGR